jgi:competence protein ComEC
MIRYNVTILDKPEYTDSKTIVRNGIWYISIEGYMEIIPGSRVSFEGKVEPKWVMGKVRQIKMIDAKVAEIEHARCVGSIHAGCVRVTLGNLREKWVGTLQKNLPEPMASLSAGILLGVKGQMPDEFYQALVNTGTLHIVAASGYNVSIVAVVLMKMVGGYVCRGLAIWIGVVGIILYVLMSGASASVVRAGIMGSLTLIAYYFGRPSEARRLLWVTAGMMLLFSPLYIVDIGFQLSFVATAGILYLEPWIKRRVDTWISSYGMIIQGYLAEYLYPTLAATIATLPVILYHFGRASWISPLVNILVLPLVPLIMGMTAAILVGGRIVAWVTYPILAYVVWVIRWFG